MSASVTAADSTFIHLFLKNSSGEKGTDNAMIHLYEPFAKKERWCEEVQVIWEWRHFLARGKNSKNSNECALQKCIFQPKA
jgi:hypothetical protein